MDKEIFQSTLDTIDEHLDWIELHDAEGNYEFRVSLEFMIHARALQRFWTPWATLDKDSVWYNGHLMVVDRTLRHPLQITRKESTPCPM